MSPVQTLEKPATTYASSQKYDVSENYEGEYRFAPIEEAEVSRAMIKRCMGLTLLSSKRRLIHYIDTSTLCMTGLSPT